MLLAITPIGVIVAGIAVWAAVLRPSALAYLAVAVCSLEATAAIITPSFGIQPYYLTGLLICLHLAWTLATKVRILGRSAAATSAILLLVACLVLAVVGAAVLPVLFEGIRVYAPGQGIDAQVASGTPLRHTTSHVAQSAYLAINVAFVLYVGLAANTRHDVRRIHRAFLTAGLIAVGVALAQKLASVIGVPFPYELVQNNASMNLRPGATFQGFVRLSGTFPEASNLAAFASAFLAYLLARIAGERRRRGVLAFAAGVTVLVLAWSTSTTAYVMVALVAVWFVWAHVVHPLLRAHGRVWHVPAVIAGALAVLAVLAATPDVRTIIVESVLGKPDSRSFAVRARADLDALALLVQTGGLGVGLGSSRPSSFATALLTNLGVIGTLLWVGAVAMLTRGAYRDGTASARATVVALATLIVAKTLSQPDLSTPALWSLVAMCMATVTVRAKERGRWIRVALGPSSRRGAPEPHGSREDSPPRLSWF